MVTHVAPAQPRTTGLSQDAAESVLFEKSQKATAPNWPATLSDTEKRNHSTVWGPKSQIDPAVPGKDLKQVLHKKPHFLL